MTTRIFLIRHGKTTWNSLRRYCGRLNVGLSCEGKRQTLKLGKQLKSVCFDRIYCSSQKRALQTAHIIFDGANFTKVKALREIDFGVLEGMHYKNIIKKYGQIYEDWIKNPYKHRLPKSEPIACFKKRVVEAINKIAGQNPGKTVAVVCHGGVIGVYVSSVKKSRNFWKYVPKATSLTIVEYKKGKPRILKFNDLTHLER